MNMTNDLSSMIKRLSILANVPVKPASRVGDGDVYDDDEDEDEEEEDEEEDEEQNSSDDYKENEKENNQSIVEIKQSTSVASEARRQSLSKQSSYPKLASSGSSSSSLNAADAFKAERNPSFYQAREAKISGSSLRNIQETDERFEPELEDEDVYEVFDEDQDESVSNSTAMPFSQQLTIKTEFLGSYSNQKSPKTQAIELGKRLELEKAENVKLKESFNSLRYKLEPRIRELTRQNEELKDELSYSKRLLRELRETNDTHQLEASKSEIRSLNDRLATAQATNAQLTSQIERLTKYEEMVKSMNLIDINQNTYQILCRIGEGGFSEVYHCISLKERKNYALKRVDLNRLETENIDSIMNEIELLRKLQSTNKVVQLVDYEHVKHKQQMNILMELGSTDLNGFLKKEIQKHGCLQEPARVFYWKKMLEAVDAIHKEGVIHSDIKPGNFLVVGCEVKLIDFNISNTVSDRTSVTMGFDCGTINYMAPESLMSDSASKTKVTKKTDVWALAVILYLMTYGKLPLQHIKNQFQLMHAICDVEKREFKFGALKNSALLDVFKKCFRHDQSDRYSVDELLRHRYIVGHCE